MSKPFQIANSLSEKCSTVHMGADNAGTLEHFRMPYEDYIFDKYATGILQGLFYFNHWTVLVEM